MKPNWVTDSFTYFLCVCTYMCMNQCLCAYMDEDVHACRSQRLMSYVLNHVLPPASIYERNLVQFSLTGWSTSLPALGLQGRTRPVYADAKDQTSALMLAGRVPHHLPPARLSVSLTFWGLPIYCLWLGNVRNTPLRSIELLIQNLFQYSLHHLHEFKGSSSYINSAIPSASIPICKTLSQKTKPMPPLPPKRNEDFGKQMHLTTDLPRGAKRATFSHHRKTEKTMGRRLYSSRPYTSAPGQRPSRVLILLFPAVSTSHWLKLALVYKTFENRSQQVLAYYSEATLLQCRRLQKSNQKCSHEGELPYLLSCQQHWWKIKTGKTPVHTRGLLFAGHHKEDEGRGLGVAGESCYPSLGRLWLAHSGPLHRGRSSVSLLSTHPESQI